MKKDLNNEGFSLTYSLAEQEELQQIRKKYLPPQEDKMEQLRRLDASTHRKPTAVAIAVGVVGALIMGLGMSLCMTELSGFLGGTAMFVGIPVGLLGMVIAAAAFPLYRKLLQQERSKVAAEILRLTDELSAQ